MATSSGADAIRREGVIPFQTIYTDELSSRVLPDATQAKIQEVMGQIADFSMNPPQKKVIWLVSATKSDRTWGANRTYDSETAARAYARAIERLDFTATVERREYTIND